MVHKLTYADFERTGHQDCDNTFGFDDVRFDSGNTAEEIVDNSLEMMEFDDWIVQNEDLDDLKPKKAYEAWKEGWRDCAIVHVQQQLRFNLTKAETLFQQALKTRGAHAVDIAQDIALENNIKLGAFSQKVAETNGYFTNVHAGSIGEFELDNAGQTWVRWETRPDDRNDPGTGSLTLNYSFRGQEWDTSIGLSRSARAIESVEWRRRALEYAWLAVKVFKDEDEPRAYVNVTAARESLGDNRPTHELIDTIKERVADFDYLEPITPDELFENPARARRRNGKPERRRGARTRLHAAMTVAGRGR